MKSAHSQISAQKWHRDGYSISTDPRDFDEGVIHGFLVKSSWAEGIPIEIARRSLEHSLGFALFEGEPGEQQVGFARVTTDFATFGYLSDVFVIDSHRGRGLGRWLCEVVMAHPDLQGFRRWLLATSTARGLYEKLGWYLVKQPEIFMEINEPDIYKKGPATNTRGGQGRA